MSQTSMILQDGVNILRQMCGLRSDSPTAAAFGPNRVLNDSSINRCHHAATASLARVSSSAITPNANALLLPRHTHSQLPFFLLSLQRKTIHRVAQSILLLPKLLHLELLQRSGCTD